MLPRLTVLFVASLLCATTARAENSIVFDPSTLKGPARGVASEVMVLGTHHIRDLPSTFDAASLNVLLDRLLAWKPQIIAIEDRSGTQCALMRQYPERYKDAVQRYCTWDPAPARATTGLDVPAATAEIDRVLATWPAAATPAQRRYMAAVFLAGGEPVSALVQWLRLPATERRPGIALTRRLSPLWTGCAPAATNRHNWPRHSRLHLGSSAWSGSTIKQRIRPKLTL